MTGTPRAPVPASPIPRTKAKPRARPTSAATPPATPRRPEKRKPPSSPSTSSARPRKRAREPPRNPKRNTRPLSATQSQSTLTYLGTPFLPDVKLVAPHSRVFAKEFQCLLFSFGDVRFCARDTLELVEDCVRDEVRRIAPGGLSAICSRLDTRGMYRLNNYFKACQMNRRVPIPRHGDPFTSFSDPFHDGLSPDPLAYWSEKLLQSLRYSMSPVEFTYLVHSKSISFAKYESFSPDPKIRGIERATLFKEWLATSCAEQDIPAVAHLTWELTGQLVQTALLCRYNCELQSQLPSASSFTWSKERHCLEALSHGIGTALTIPCSELHAARLMTEIRWFINRPYTRRFHLRSRADGLMPRHIYAALSQLKERGWGGKASLRAGLFDFV
ncbi:Transcription initiation factor IID subunit 13 [Gracilaria domingensis]|nr:Transcription initiation factor IID subunit 13 [Gracilaria domingensis]